ncbi:MAG: RAD55 family ATPase [Chloroflexia bacterium]
MDSFKAIHDLSESRPALRWALYRFSATLATLPCTTLLVGEYAPDGIADMPEATIVDGIIELSNRTIGLRDYRSLRVAKLRGCAYRSGEHAFRITSDGIAVFPRFVTPPTPAVYAASRERAATGIAGLDELLHGGLLRGTTTLVVGDPGVGKTVTSLHFLLNGVRQGEPGAYISFQEDPNQLAQIARNFGFDLEPWEREGRLAMLYTSPVELDVDEQVLQIVGAAERVGARRAVIDSISDFIAGTQQSPERYFNYIYSLAQYFKNRGTTALLTYEISTMFGREVLTTGRGVSHIADNVLLMRYRADGARIRRVLAVLRPGAAATATRRASS